MKKSQQILLLALGFAGCMQFAQAASLLTVGLPGGSLNYPTTVGSSFDAGIYISGTPDLGYFDFSITYDSTKLSALSFDSASIFGAGTDTAYFLTDAGGNYVPDTITVAAGKGTVHFAETISDISSIYAGPTGFDATNSTLLGTLHFKALAVGANSLVNIISPVLSDFSGNSLAGSIQAANVTITQPAAVPLPAAFWLFAPGLLAVFGKKRQSAVV